MSRSLIATTSSQWGHGVSGSKPTTEYAALVAALLTEERRITRGALVNDGRLWETASKAELELVGWSLAETKTTLAAGIRAVGLATSRWEVATACGAHPLVVGTRAIVMQRSFPQVAAGVAAWKHQ